MKKPEEFEPLLENMRQSWNERASENARYYVSTDSRGEADFAASGRVNYEQIVRPFLPVLLRGRSPASCRVVEIGCGLGRMTACFAQDFQEVHGVDVSAEMISQARERLGGLGNVVLHLGTGKDLAGLPDAYFDLAFSYIVFQHIPSRDVIRSYVRDAARVLQPGGAFHFQLNGYQEPDYRREEKDSWKGESFTVPEAVEMLTDAGFRPFNIVGAGTQYFILSARREDPQADALSPFVLPGAAWPAGQFLEGWAREIPGDCRPLGTTNRIVLGVPERRPLRFFLSLDAGPAQYFPRFTVAIDGSRVGEAEIGGPGDYYWEFPVPDALCHSSRATVELAFEAVHRYSVRSLGIYAPEVGQVGKDESGSIDGSRRQAARAAEAGERVLWIANLEQECARSARSIRELQADLESKVAWARSLDRDLETKIAWARSLESDVEKAGDDLTRLRADFEERTAWARSLESDVEKAREDLTQLRADFDERTAWAFSLQSDAETARGWVAHHRKESGELTERVKQLEAALQLAHDKPWRLMAKKLRSRLKGGRG